jgi:hypothetical protein
MASSTTFRKSPPLTAEEAEAERRYQEVIAKIRGSQSAPSSPVNVHDNRPVHNQTWDLRRFSLDPPTPPNPPSPPESQSQSPSSDDPEPQLAPTTDSDNPHVPPTIGSKIKFVEPCIKCGKPYAADEVWIIINQAMQKTPEPYIKLDWARANLQDRWETYVRDLSKQRLVRGKMDAMCAACILRYVSRAQRWPAYDEECRAWVHSFGGKR